VWRLMAGAVVLGVVGAACYVAKRRQQIRGSGAERRAIDRSHTASTWRSGFPARVPTAPFPDGGPAVAHLIKEKFGVDLAWRDQEYPVKTHYGLIRATDAKTAEVDLYCAVLRQEFLLYPPDLVRRTRLQRIVLCRGLSFNGQDRAAVPDFEHDSLYLDVVSGAYSRIYQRRVIHHDFFHIIDYRDDGRHADEMWASLNPKGFRYGSGGAKMQDDSLSGLPSAMAGFVTSYAASAVEEDKAELFSHMMTEYADVAARASTDPVIRRKVLAMRALLARFCPAMDETFWDEVSRSRVKALDGLGLLGDPDLNVSPARI
jgi:hypothetical protein